MKKEVYITVNYCYIHKYDLLRERERERELRNLAK